MMECVEKCGSLAMLWVDGMAPNIFSWWCQGPIFSWHPDGVDVHMYHSWREGSARDAHLRICACLCAIPLILELQNFRLAFSCRCALFGGEELMYPLRSICDHSLLHVQRSHDSIL